MTIKNLPHVHYDHQLKSLKNASLNQPIPKNLKEVHFMRESVNKSIVYSAMSFTFLSNTKCFIQKKDYSWYKIDKIISKPIPNTYKH